MVSCLRLATAAHKASSKIHISSENPSRPATKPVYACRSIEVRAAAFSAASGASVNRCRSAGVEKGSSRTSNWHTAKSARAVSRCLEGRFSVPLLVSLQGLFLPQTSCGFRGFHWSASSTSSVLNRRSPLTGPAGTSGGGNSSTKDCPPGELGSSGKVQSSVGASACARYLPRSLSMNPHGGVGASGVRESFEGDAASRRSLSRRSASVSSSNNAPVECTWHPAILNSCRFLSPSSRGINQRGTRLDTRAALSSCARSSSSSISIPRPSCKKLSNTTSLSPCKAALLRARLASWPVLRPPSSSPKLSFSIDW
mmetsp:Transcript_29650/g.71235  ORF Transcript_29650/g.71235 Transcript_29650/m.71235 type:complete len:312 (+) Transcript_29650:978-1913(+)